MTLSDGNTFNICDGKPLINDIDNGGMEIISTDLQHILQSKHLLGNYGYEFFYI